jgi:hypothetical protein
MAKKTKKGEESLGFNKLNYILMAVGLGMIVLGYIFLAAGDITGSPILLVLGYCAVLPIAILIGRKSKEPTEHSDSGTDPAADNH